LGRLTLFYNNLILLLPVISSEFHVKNDVIAQFYPKEGLANLLRLSGPDQQTAAIPSTKQKTMAQAMVNDESKGVGVVAKRRWVTTPPGYVPDQPELH
jgi:hypothetical protein